MTKNKIVFTNGCFDILHIGHIKILEYCRELGDYVIVGLNSDRSVRELKGFSRPINTQEQRKQILESIKYVNEVIIFDDTTPLELIKEIRPDFVVKGADYSEEEVVGFGLDGITVRICEYVPGASTTKIIQDIANR